MKSTTFTVAAALIFVGSLIGQDLPPEVLLLSRIQRQIREELQQLSNITCLETTQREHQPAKGKMRPLDTVRLEVLVSGNRELFASPGDRKFSEQHPISYVGSGTLGGGFFGLHLKVILLSRHVIYTYKGEEEIAGHRAARWDFRLPPMWSGQVIHLPEGSGTVGLHGSIWADPQTHDVIRLELNGDDFPATLPLSEAVWTINYARTALGENVVVLLPQSGEFRMVRFSGEMSHNLIEFTHCRLFGAQSTISFDPAERTPNFALASVDDTFRSLPSGLQIAVSLRSRISAGMTVGTLISGVVAANVPGKGAVLIAKGSPVRGRIRRLERYADPLPHFVVALEFTEVEVQGIRHRFYADLISFDTEQGAEETLSTPHKSDSMNLWSGGRRIQSTTERLTFTNLPGVATFFFRGGKLDLQPGFRTVWKTRDLAR